MIVLKIQITNLKAASVPFSVICLSCCSFFPVCFSTSMYAPVASRIALILPPARPMTRAIEFEDTDNRVERRRL